MRWNLGKIKWGRMKYRTRGGREWRVRRETIYMWEREWEIKSMETWKKMGNNQENWNFGIY